MASFVTTRPRYEPAAQPSQQQTAATGCEASADQQDSHWYDNSWDWSKGINLSPVEQALLLDSLVGEELLDDRANMRVDLCGKLEQSSDTVDAPDHLGEELLLELSDEKLHDIDKKCEQIFEERDKQFERARKQRRAQVREAYEAALADRIKAAEAIEANHEPGVGGDEDQYQQESQLVSQECPKSKKQRRREPPESRLPHSGSDHVCALSKIMASIVTQNFRWSWDTKWPNIERGLLHLLFAFKEFAQVRDAIEQIDFAKIPRPWFKEIQDLWNFSNYNLVDLRKPITEYTPVNTFRIRHKYPCPTWSITGKPKYDIPANAHQRLKQFYSQTSQRPNRSQKQELAKDVGLTYNTVTNWFKNRRQRDKDSAQRQYREQQEQVLVSYSQAPVASDSVLPPSQANSTTQYTYYYPAAPATLVDSQQQAEQKTFYYDHHSTISYSTSCVSSSQESGSSYHLVSEQQGCFCYPTKPLSPQQIVAQSAQYQSCCSYTDVQYEQYELYGAQAV